MKKFGKILILALGIAAWSDTHSQTYSLLVHDETIEDFFKQLSKNLPHEIIKMNEDILEWSEQDIYGEQDTLFQLGELSKGLMEINKVHIFFSELDLKYVERQYNHLDGDHWYPEDFRRFEIIDSVGLNKIMSHSFSEKKMGKNYSYTFSIPLFSLNKEYAIVQQEFDCGFECSTYCIHIYKRLESQKSWVELTSWKCISAGAKHE